MTKNIRWGLMGAGNIINRWINGARQPDGMKIVAVASRTKERAKEMGDSHGISKVMTYEEMASSDEIDVVYIPVPHTAHLELALMAMRGGKAVLLEKPAAISAPELQQMLDCARENNVFFMEAVWTRFFPLVDKLYGLIGPGSETRGGIGEVRAVNCAFSSRVSTKNLQHRVLNPMLAGGGLLDIGVYNLHLCDMIFNRDPVKLMGLATINSDELKLGVDEQAMYLAQYDKGELASMASGVRTKMIDTAFLYGTHGYIEMPEFWRPKRMRVTIDGITTEHTETVALNNPAYLDEGFSYEVQHVNECIRAGLIESPVMTWESSMRIMRQCDELRRQWDLIYPFEFEAR